MCVCRRVQSELIEVFTTELHLNQVNGAFSVVLTWFINQGIVFFFGLSFLGITWKPAVWTTSSTRWKGTTGTWHASGTTASAPTGKATGIGTIIASRLGAAVEAIAAGVAAEAAGTESSGADAAPLASGLHRYENHSLLSPLLALSQRVFIAGV